MSREDERRLGAADFARAEPQHPEQDVRSEHLPQGGSEPMPERGMPQQAQRPMQGEPLAALFQGEAADRYRRRWDEIQIAFVDDPEAAVRNADELVAEVLRSLAESFSRQRSTIESGLAGTQPDTENMRVALQRYRSFFQRLLAL